MSKEGSTPEQITAYRTALAEALQSVCIPYLHDSVAYTDSGFHRAITTSALAGMLSTLP